jgi:hypothetical protein
VNILHGDEDRCFMDRVIRPLLPGRLGLDNTQHQMESKEIISKLIWLILIDRFEILSSVVHTFFETYAGVGSELLMFWASVPKT